MDRRRFIRNAALTVGAIALPIGLPELERPRLTMLGCATGVSAMQEQALGRPTDSLMWMVHAHGNYIDSPHRNARVVNITLGKEKRDALRQ